jgi:hypothetical protein
MPRAPRPLLVAAVATLATLVAGAPASGQERPDFSGRWTTGPAPDMRGRRAGPPGDMGSGWGPDIVVRQDAETLTVEALIFAPGDLQPPLTYRYPLSQGAHAVNRILMGHGIQELPTTTRWDGDRLVLTTTHTFAHPETGRRVEADVTRVLSLEGPNSLVAPPSLVVEMTIDGVLGGPPTTTRTVYTAG